MVRKKTHRKRKSTGLKTKKLTHRQRAAIKALESAGKAGYDLGKKHITKENVKKALEASKKATSYLKGLFKKKKKDSPRVTMSIYRK